MFVQLNNSFGGLSLGRVALSTTRPRVKWLFLAGVTSIHEIHSAFSNIQCQLLAKAIP